MERKSYLEMIFERQDWLTTTVINIYKIAAILSAVMMIAAACTITSSSEREVIVTSSLLCALACAMIHNSITKSYRKWLQKNSKN